MNSQLSRLQIIFELVSLRKMVFGSNLTGLYSGLQPLAAPAKTTTGPFVAAAPAEGMSDTSVALVAGAL